VCKGRATGGQETEGGGVKLFTTYLVVMATVVVAVVAAPFAQAADPTPAQLRALEIRGQAMNKLCDDPTRSREAYRALCGNAGASNQPTAAELRALEIRGQAMNKLCDDPTRSREAYRALCGNIGASNQPTAAEIRAFESRGVGMSNLCETLSGDGYVAVCGVGEPVAASETVRATVSNGFDWTDFGIGAGAMLGLVLLAGGIGAGVHYGRRSSVRPRPAA
jgi:hypothetical protein